MATDWIAEINQQFDRLGLAPDIDANAVQDRPDLVAIEDQQCITVYRDPEEVSLLLAMLSLPQDATARELFELIGQTLQAQCVEDDEAVHVRWTDVEGYSVV